MKVSIDGPIAQACAAAGLTETIRSKFNMNSPHDFAKGVIEFCDRYNLDHKAVLQLTEEKLSEITKWYFQTATTVLVNRLTKRAKEQASEKSE